MTPPSETRHRIAVLAAFLVASGITMSAVVLPLASPITVHASVLDSAGRPVGDLTRNDFEILDAGTRQGLIGFSTGPSPVSIVLLVDASGSMTMVWDRLTDAANRFISHVGPDDRVKAARLSHGVALVPTFSADHDALLAQLQLRLPPRDDSAILDATFAGLDALRGESNRRAIVLMTDGDDESSRRKLPEVVQQAQTDDTVVSAVAFWTTVIGRAQSPGRPVKLLTADTGGGYAEARNQADVLPATDSIAHELRTCYTLTFLPQRVDGKLHSLKILVRRPGVVVHARTAYLAR